MNFVSVGATLAVARVPYGDSVHPSTVTYYCNIGCYLHNFGFRT